MSVIHFTLIGAFVHTISPYESRSSVFLSINSSLLVYFVFVRSFGWFFISKKKVCVFVRLSLSHSLSIFVCLFFVLLLSFNLVHSLPLACVTLLAFFFVSVCGKW